MRACYSGSSALARIEHADPPHVVGLLRARRQRPCAAAPPSVNMNSRRRMWLAMRPLPPEVVCMQ